MCLGLGNGCVPKEEKKTSLLKPYTRFEKFKDMTLDEIVKAIEKNCGKGCPLFDDCNVKEDSDCFSQIKRWLESED